MNRILILTLGTFVLGTELFVIAGILPALSRDLGVGIPAAGQLVTVFALTYAFGAPILALLTASIPRRRLLAVSLLLFAVSNLAAALAPDYAWMLAARIFSALTACLYLPSASAVAASLATPERRGKALATVVLGLSLATIAGVPLGIGISNLFGWRWVFGAIAALAMGTGIAIRMVLPEVAALPIASLGQRLAVLRRPGVARGLLLTSIVLMGVFSVYVYLAPLLLDRAGIRSNSLVGLLTVFGGAGILGAWLGGAAVDRFGSARTLAVCLLFLLVALAGFSTAARGWWSSALLLATWGVFGTAFNPVQQHRLLSLAPQDATSIFAWNSSCVYLGQALAGAMGGLVVHFAGVSFLGFGGAACLAVALLLLLGRLPLSRGRVVS